MSNPTINTIEKKWQEMFKTITGAKTDIQNRISIEREIIPIIFIPGIMGSRLMRKDGSKAWDPDDNGFMFKEFGLKSSNAKKKKKLLVGPNGFTPDFLRVIRNDSKQVEKYFKNYSKAVERGWTGVMWGSYGPILESMHNNKMWPELVGICFDFPVHAFGYNWSASAKDTGMHLVRYIKETVDKYRSGNNSQNKKPRMCERVILVTHSMGGLVARFACKELDREKDKKVLGVIHGVQPALGSPAAYWRMKAGFERPQGGPTKSAWHDWKNNPKKMLANKITNTVGAWVLGTDGQEVTALLGNMPGGLQLLPNTLYTDNHGNKSWLNFQLKDGNFVSFPKKDPYREIYRLEDGPYRMVNPEWLDPGGKNDKYTPKKISPWRLYLSYLALAEDFHADLGIYVHPNTCQFYSSGLLSPDVVVFSRQSVVNNENPCVEDDYIPFTNKGSYQAYVDRNDEVVPYAKGAAYIISLARPIGSGDGTVPDSSAMALPLKKGQTVKIFFETDNEWFDNGHQGIYGTKKAENIVINGIGNLAIKRIEQEIGATRMEATKAMYKKLRTHDQVQTMG